MNKSEFRQYVLREDPIPKLTPEEAFEAGKRGDGTAYRWFITGSAAKMFLEAILPYLKLKKEIAELGIELQTCIEDWKYFLGSKRLSTEEIVKRDTLITKYRELQRPQPTRGRRK